MTLNIMKIDNEVLNIKPQVLLGKPESAFCDFIIGGVMRGHILSTNKGNILYHTVKVMQSN